jgi:2-polyprenyl-6-methoxyphenol hydroxylase-like FAD-dependent oxidoreductase
MANLSSVAIIGAGPAGLALALSLARRGSGGDVVVFDRAEDHDTAPRYNPDRSYTIDITGHGARALEYMGVTRRFDKELIKFRGIRIKALAKDEPWDGPGWTGSRGDICRTLLSECKVLV